MTKLRPTDLFPSWKKETVLKRALACAGMLHVHQFMSDKERLAVQRRLTKWLDKNVIKPNVAKSVDGVCCNCGLSDAKDRDCPASREGTHCKHWWCKPAEKRAKRNS
jgi:hypothetical protein